MTEADKDRHIARLQAVVSHLQNQISQLNVANIELNVVIRELMQDRGKPDAKPEPVRPHDPLT